MPINLFTGLMDEILVWLTNEIPRERSGRVLEDPEVANGQFQTNIPGKFVKNLFWYPYKIGRILYEMSRKKMKHFYI